MCTMTSFVLKTSTCDVQRTSQRLRVIDTSRCGYDTAKPLALISSKWIIYWYFCSLRPHLENNHLRWPNCTWFTYYTCATREHLSGDRNISLMPEMDQNVQTNNAFSSSRHYVHNGLRQVAPPGCWTSTMGSCHNVFCNFVTDYMTYAFYISRDNNWWHLIYIWAKTRKLPMCLPTYLCLFARWEHRPSTKECHCCLSVAILSIYLLVYPISFVSLSVSLCQVSVTYLFVSSVMALTRDGCWMFPKRVFYPPLVFLLYFIF